MQAYVWIKNQDRPNQNGNLFEPVQYRRCWTAEILQIFSYFSFNVQLQATLKFLLVAYLTMISCSMQFSKSTSLLSCCQVAPRQQDISDLFSLRHKCALYCGVKDLKVHLICSDLHSTKNRGILFTTSFTSTSFWFQPKVCFFSVDFHKSETSLNCYLP